MAFHLLELIENVAWRNWRGRGLPGRRRPALFENGTGRAAPARQNGHQERGGEKQRAEDGGRARERIRLAAACHEAAGPAARPERAALRALQQDDPDQRDDDQNVNDEEDGLHGGLERPERRPQRLASSTRWRAPNTAE